ncbi:MAG TPA: OsmC family protein [Bacteroidales bacterium]|nr:OsmC family protein [Bacteroidales bacterium]
MTKIKMTALGGFRTKSIHLQSGVELLTDAPVDNHGKGEYFSPTDLLATALASCMITIMDVAGQQHGFSVEGTEIDILKIMSENPRKVAEIVIHIHFPKTNNYSEKNKKIISHAVKNCPVALSLHPDIKQTVHLNY